VKQSNVTKIVVETPQWNRPLGILRRVWEYNIKMNVREVERKGVECVEMFQDRL
jgi:hypothetical protein